MAMDVGQDPYAGGSTEPDWFDENDPGGTTVIDPGTWVPEDGQYGHPVYNQIAEFWQRYNNGERPTLAQVSQWGTNVSGAYMNQIAAAIQRQAQSRQAPAGQTPATGSGGGTGRAWDEVAFRDGWLAAGGGPEGLRRYVESGGWGQHVRIVGSKGDKIQLPDGRVIDAVRGAGAGGMEPQWLVEGAGGGGETRFDTPWTEEYNPPQFEPPPDFVAPNPEDLFKDRAYQFRVNEGVKALQRSAAANGTLLTGGTLKDISSWVSDYSSDEYGKLYDRAITEDQMRYGRDLGEYEIGRENALTRYGIARENFYAGQDRPWGRLMDLTGVGLNALNSSQNLNARYGAGYTDALRWGTGDSNDYRTGGAAASAAGRVGSSNAWSQGLSGAGNSLVTGAYLYRPGGSTRPAIPGTY